MEIKDVLEDFKKQLINAHHDMEVAKEMIVIGEELKLDVAKPRMGIREVESKMKLFETVIDKHLKKDKD